MHFKHHFAKDRFKLCYVFPSPPAHVVVPPPLAAEVVLRRRDVGPVEALRPALRPRLVTYNLKILIK